LYKKNAVATWTWELSHLLLKKCGTPRKPPSRWSIAGQTRSI